VSGIHENMAVSADYHTVNQNLAVRLTASDVDRHPDLVKLLASLQQITTSDGMTTSTNNDIKQAKATLRHAKTRWYQQHLLYEELQEMLLDHDLNAQKQPSAASQFYAAAKESLALAEIRDYLRSSPDPDIQETLLGLKEEDLERHNPHKKHLSAIQQQLIPDIEAHLKKKCETLVSMHELSAGSSGGEPDRFTFARASQLPGLLEGELDELEEQERQLTKLRYSRERQFWQYYKAIMESLEVLEKLITRHRLSAQKEKDKVAHDWVQKRCEALSLKIKLLEYQTLCETYEAGTTAALKEIRKQLDHEVESTTSDVDKVNLSLKAYDGTGLGFETLVREYTHLRDEIENKKWAMNELKQSLLH